MIFGTVTLNLHDLPPAIAMNTLRIAGKRVLAEAKAANAQIKATKAALVRPEAMGLLALITPPFRLDRHSIVALVGDAMRDIRCSSIDQLFLVETPLAAPEPFRRWGNSFMSLHSRRDGDRILPQHLAEAIGHAWGRCCQSNGASYVWRAVSPANSFGSFPDLLAFCPKGRAKLGGTRLQRAEPHCFDNTLMTVRPNQDRRQDWFGLSVYFPPSPLNSSN